MNTNSNRKILPYIIMLVVVVIAFWQVAFFVYGLKWDLIDVVFPFRYHFSECLGAGYFPFWNPYQQTGTPFFADLQAPTYYPELFVVSLLGGYGIYSMHLLFIMYLVIAATGMYKLSFYFNSNKTAALIAGMAYALSGFMVGHGQHFFLLVGAAWIPFVVYFYLKVLTRQLISDVVKTAVALFLLVTGAYQALTVVMLYLLAMLFLFHFIIFLRNKQLQQVRSIIWLNGVLLLLVVILCMPLILSTFEVITSVDRLEQGISLAGTLQNGQGLTSLLSFLIPFSTLKNLEFFNCFDSSLVNYYIGLIPLIFLVASFFTRRKALEYVLFFFGLVILAMVFKELPVRQFMFEHVPMMNMFKTAGYVRVYALLVLILLASNFMANALTNHTKLNKGVLLVSIGCWALLALVGGFAIIRNSLGDYIKLTKVGGFESILAHMHFYQHVALQAFFQLAVVSIFIFLWMKAPNWKYFKPLLVVLVFVELFMAAQLNMSKTVVSMSHKPKRMQQEIKNCPEKFPLPIDSKIVFNDQKNGLESPFWRNTYIFRKQVAFQSFSSFELKTYNKLDDAYPNLRDAVLDNHLFYFSDEIYPISSFHDDSIPQKNSHSFLYLDDTVFLDFSVRQLQTDSSDIIKMTAFSPNRIVAQASTSNDQLLTMLQTNFKGWRAYIDEVETPVYTSNFNYRTIFLPKGKHVIRFEYSNRRIVNWYVISMIGLLLLTLYLVYSCLRQRGIGNTWFYIVSGVIIAMLTIGMLRILSYSDTNLTTYEALNTKFTGRTAIKHVVVRPSDDRGSDALLLQPDTFYQVKPEHEYVPIARISNESGVLNATTMLLKTRVKGEEYTKGLIVSEIIRNGTSIAWHSSKLESQIEKPGSWNDILYLKSFLELKADDELKLYIWNLEHQKFLLDSVDVTFY